MLHNIFPHHVSWLGEGFHLDSSVKTLISKVFQRQFQLSRVLVYRTRLFNKNSMLRAPLRHVSTAMVFGMMIPLSFSIFPQLGTVRLHLSSPFNTPQGVWNTTPHVLPLLQIKKEKLEKELQEAAVDGKLFYHRGLWGGGEPLWHYLLTPDNLAHQNIKTVSPVLVLLYRFLLDSGCCWEFKTTNGRVISWRHSSV